MSTGQVAVAWVLIESLVAICLQLALCCVKVCGASESLHDGVSMRFPRWLASPLTGTAGVLAGLCLLAVPLRKLTSAASAARDPAPARCAKEIPAVLRLKLLAPARSVRLTAGDGVVLLDLTAPSAGESGHDAVIPFAEGGLDIVLRADFGDGTSETAVFLTVLPDGYEEKTCYATGAGLLEETLRYDWPSR